MVNATQRPGPMSAESLVKTKIATCGSQWLQLHSVQGRQAAHHSMLSLDAWSKLGRAWKTSVP